MPPDIHYRWSVGSDTHELRLVHVAGTGDTPFPFGHGAGPFRPITVQPFYIQTTPVTQALWCHVMDPAPNPAINRASPLHPQENVSWDSLTSPGGFLDRLNQSPARQGPAFRLPSEAEWEYAARGGPQWPDALPFSGSRDIESVAWYDRRHGDHTQPVARKAPNQLGLYDMSGNVWEWCQDTHTPDIDKIPPDGTPYQGPGPDRVLRGGCFHNWAIHCTVFKRYEIASDAHDGCIGFRLVLPA